MEQQVQAHDEAGSSTPPPSTPSHSSDSEATPEPPLHDVLTQFEVELKKGMGEPLPEAVEGQTEAKPEETPTTPQGDDGESPPPAVDYGAIPQAPVMGKDQQPMTIGEMKDEITESRTTRAKVEKLEFDLMRHRDTVNQILANNGPLTDDQRQQMQDVVRQLHQQQQQTVKDMFPEWEDPSIRNKVIPELTRIAGSAGFSKPEVEKLTHPAIFNLLERVRRYEEREALGIEAMKAATRPKAEKGQSPRPPSSKSTKFGSVADKIAGGGDSPQDWYELDKLLGVDR